MRNFRTLNIWQEGITIVTNYELETQLIIIEELSLISNKEVAVIIDPINKEQKMINNLITRLKANS